MCVCVCCTVFVNVCPPLQVARLQESLTEAKSESAVLREKVATMTTTLEQQRQSDEEEREGLKKRADGLTQQNSLLHEESEKMAARIITLQEQGRSEGELRELREVCEAERETATQHAEILAKVSVCVCVCLGPLSSVCG